VLGEQVPAVLHVPPGSFFFTVGDGDHQQQTGRTIKLKTPGQMAELAMRKAQFGGITFVTPALTSRT
jgi:hypothetical protein